MNTRSALVKKIFFGLLLASLCTPLIVVSGFAFPFVTPRELFFRTVMLLLIPFSFVVLYGSGEKRKKRIGIVGIGIALMLCAIFVSTIFSVDVQTSFWGFAERFGGAISLLLYMLFGFFVMRTARDGQQRKILFYVFVGVWTFVALFAIVERYFPGMWRQFHGEGTRSVATVGNPIFLASGLLLAGSFIESEIFRVIQDVKKRNAFAVLVALLFGSAILFTETRGADLGLFVGVIACALCLIAWSSRRVQKVGVGVIVLLVVLVGGLWLLRNTATVQSISFMGRVWSNPLTDASTVQRFQMWQVALNAISVRPITGWGLENFDTALDRLYIPNFTRYGVSNSYSDRAHNNYLDVGATTGIFGLVGYLLFLSGLVYLIQKKRKEGVLSSVSASLLIGGLVAYAVSDITAFDTQVVYFALAFFAAMVMSVKNEMTDAESRHIESTKEFPVAFPVVVLSIFSIAIFFVSIVPLARGATLVNTVATNDTLQVILQSGKMLLSFANPYRAPEEQRIGNRIFTLVGNGAVPASQTREALQVAESLLQDETAIRPQNFSPRFTLANIILLQASHGYRSFDDALKVFEKARVLSPNRQLVDYQEGNLYLMTKKFDQAIAVFRHALSLDSTVLESHWHLARGLAAAGQTAEAAKEFQTAWNGGFRGERPPQEYAVAVSTLVSVNDLPMVRSLYEAWVLVEPNKSDLYASLGTVDATLGDKEAAIVNVKKAVQLDPTIQSELPAFAQKFNIPLSAFIQ